jgi:GNAT superfamily N-acetyltransferase
MIFRQANVNDLPILLEYEQALLDAERPFDDAIREEECFYYDLPALIEDENTCLMVIDNEGQVIGCGYGQIRPSKPAYIHSYNCYLNFMYVDSNHRGKGLVVRLIEEIGAWSKSKGVTDFYLDVYADNPAAIRAYEKLGFSPNLIEMKMSL